MKSAFISIVGRPSAGKSTLVNAICGHKISIVSAVPQTTRNRVKAILTQDEGQLVFLDTPGYHTSDKKFNKSLNKVVTDSLKDADIIMYVLDLTRLPGDEEEDVAKLLNKYADKLIIVLNKTDDKKANIPAPFIAFLRDHFDTATVVPCSALKGDGVKDVTQALFDVAPEGEMLYPVEYYTDQDPAFRIREIIREKAINRLSDELPHALYVDIEDLELNEEEDLLWIRAVIFVEKESQKGMVVGKGGAKLGKIRELAKREIKTVFPNKIKLDIRVKVNAKWRRNDRVVKHLVD